MGFLKELGIFLSGIAGGIWLMSIVWHWKEKIKWGYVRAAGLLFWIASIVVNIHV